MRFKMVQSEVDGLFMKANRKHQILLNFELKRIAVEQKMRERYYSFEKSLIVARQSKIITRQKALGIYRPKTTLPDKNPNAANAFFISNVSMETKTRVKLPPLREEKVKPKFSSDKEEITASSSLTISSRNNAVGVKRNSLPEVKEGWSLTEIGGEEESMVDKWVRDSTKNSMDSGLKADTKRGCTGEVTGNVISQQDGINHDSSPEKILGENGAERGFSTTKNQKSYEKTGADTCNTREAADKTLDSQQATEDSEAKYTNKPKQKFRGASEETLNNDRTNKPSSLRDGDIHRPKSASSLGSSLEEVKSELLNLSLRAQSAGVKAK